MVIKFGILGQPPADEPEQPAARGYKEMVKGIFFDLGGTLFSYDLWAGTIADLMGTLARKFERTPDEIAHHYRLANKEIDEVYAQRTFYLFREYFEAIFADCVKRIGASHDPGDFNWYKDHVRGKMLHCLQPRSDCHATLARLRDMGLYLSAVSNIDEDMLHPLIERERLDTWLTHWTSSEAAQSCKPDRRFFEVALEKSGLSADEVVFVGDSLEQDILGAHALGMTTVLIAGHHEPAPMHVGRDAPDPDHTISHLSELPGLVTTLGVATAGN